MQIIKQKLGSVRLKIRSCCESSKKLKFCYLFIAILTLLFQSCQLEPNPTGDRVEVQILCDDGFPIRSEGLPGVGIGNNAIVSPNGMGYCSFENVQLPFDLRILSWRGYADIYKNISVRNLHLSTFSYFSNYKECIVLVKFPQIEYGKYGYVRFISKDLFKQDNGYHLIEGGSIDTTFFNLLIPPNQTTISGRLIFIQCQSTIHNYPENIYSFDKFGFKDVAFHSGLNEKIIFSPEDIAFNPEESRVRVNITYPGTYYTDLIFTLSFPGYNKHSDIIIGKYRSWSSNMSQIVPVSLNIPFNIKVESTYYIPVPPYYLLNPLKAIYVHPDESNNILHKKINLESPQNHEEGITGNSLLKAEETEERGIYVFVIAKGSITHPKVNIITDKSSIMLKDINPSNFVFSPNTVYAWIVGKLSSFNSIDQFVSEPYVFQENFNTIEFSDVWYFKTAP
jgi:hypothetical protein